MFGFGPSSSPCNSFPYCFSMFIRLFCYILFVTIFCSKIVLFPCYPVVGVSVCILPNLLVEFSFVVLECSVSSVLFLFRLNIFLAFLLLPEPSNLFPRVILLCCFFFRSIIFQRFSSVLSVWLLSSIFNLYFPYNFPSRFCVSVRVIINSTNFITD